MKRISGRYAVTAAFCAILLTGCSGVLSNTRDITDFKLISITGVDAEKGGRLKLTVSAREEPLPNQSGSNGDKPFLLTGSAFTVSRAFDRMESFTDKTMFLGHDRYCLIGEDLAKRGIDCALDFFTRDTNARLDTKLFVVKGETAEKLLTKASGNNAFAADRLSSLEKDTEKRGGPGMTSLVDISGSLEENGSAVIRALELAPVTSHDSSADSSDGQAEGAAPNNGGGERLDFEIDGYAVIKDLKLLGYLSGGEAMGYDLLKGGAGSGVLEVSAPDGGQVALRAGKAERALSVKWEGGTPSSLKVKLSFKSAIAETLSRGHIEDAAFLNALAEKQNGMVKEMVQSALDKSKELDCDFCGIGSMINRRHPVKFSKMKDRWSEIWRTLPVEIEVVSRVSSSYGITEPESGKDGTV